MGTCPKCGAERVAGASDCPQCGAIYAKVEAAAKRQQKMAEEAAAAEQQRALEEANKNLMSCPSCHQTISKTAAVCPHCGDSAAVRAQLLLEAEKAKARKKVNIGCGVLTGIVILLIAIGNFSGRPKPPVGILVTKPEYGDKWPFTIPEGTIYCLGYKEVVIKYEEKFYAVNGSAMGGNKYHPLTEIWRDNPQYPGGKIPPTGIIKRGLDLCKD